jgi:hypothetical protein
MYLLPSEPTRNLLPFDGITNYYGPILASGEAQDYLEALLTTVPWRNDEAVICGKHIVTALFVHLFRNDQDRASLDEGIANPQEPGRRGSWMFVQFMSLQSVP